MSILFRLLAAGLSALVTLSVAAAQTPPRIRGTIAAVEADSLRIASTAGESSVVALAPGTVVTLCERAALGDIKPGSFIGTAATTQPDGTLVAREVHVFPESMRGAGEGHRPFDLGPASTMTNGTVGQEVVGTAGQTLTVLYKGGEKRIVVPPDVPVVTFAPGDRSSLVPGARIIAFIRATANGTLSADRITVGKDGLVPPM